MSAPNGINAVPSLKLAGPGSVGAATVRPKLNIVKPAPEVHLGSLVDPHGRRVRDVVTLLVLLFLIDDSGSRYGTFGTDPSDMRDAAVRSLLTLLRKSGGGRAGVIRWGSDVGLVQPTSDVLKQKKALKQALSEPANLGGTNLPPALARAATELSGLKSNDVPVVFVITDGVCDPGVDVDAGIARLPANSVHVLLQDVGNYCTPEIEDAWRQTTAASVTRLTTCDTETTALELAGVFANTVGLALAPATKSDKK